MKNLFKIPTLLVAPLLFVCACGTSKQDQREATSSRKNSSSDDAVGKPTGDQSSNQTADDPTTRLAKYLTVSYKEDLKPLLSSYCTTQCHNAVSLDAGPLLDSYDTVKNAVEEMTKAIQNQKMPPAASSSLSPEQKTELSLLADLLEEWREDEYLNTYATFTVRYGNLLGPMSNEICLNCHTINSNVVEPDLNSYAQWQLHAIHIADEVKDQRMPPRINSDQSKRLLHLIEQWQNSQMPF